MTENWIDRILSSNAGRQNPEAAKALIEKAGGDVSAVKGFFPTPSSPTALPPVANSNPEDAVTGYCDG